MLKVSAVIPAFNAAKFVVDAIRSVEQQTHPIHEIVIVDDGSKDGTAGRVQEYRSRLVRFIQKGNQGSAAARNVGIRAAKGEVIAFLDADDLWAPEKTAKQIARMQQTGAVFAYCGKAWIDVDGHNMTNRDPQVTYPEGYILRDLIRGNCITSASCVIATKRSLEETGGFNENDEFRNGQDYELWLRMARKYTMVAVREELVYYRRHRNNVTNNRRNYYMGAIRALESVDAQTRAERGMQPLQSLIRNRTRELVNGAILEMFHKHDYSAQRQFVLMALERGFISWPNFHLNCLSVLPGPLIDLIRRWKTGAGKALGR